MDILLESYIYNDSWGFQYSGVIVTGTGDLYFYNFDGSPERMSGEYFKDINWRINHSQHLKLPRHELNTLKDEIREVLSGPFTWKESERIIFDGPSYGVRIYDGEKSLLVFSNRGVVEGRYNKNLLAHVDYIESLYKK